MTARQVRKTTVRSRAGAPPVEPSDEFVTGEPTIVGRKPGTIKFLKGVFFGPPKTAKTTAACSGQNTLLIQFDPDGDVTTTLAGREDITVVEPKTFEETEALVRALGTTDKDRFPFIVLDSVTFMFMRFDGGQINKAYRENRNIMRPYGRAGAMASQIIHDLCQLDAHVLFTAHLQKEDEVEGVILDQEVGEHEVKLAVTPMVWKTLGPAVTFIGRTFRKTEYVDPPTGTPGKRRKKEDRFYVSFNDGDRSPAGARIELSGEMEITTTLMQELADNLKEA